MYYLALIFRDDEGYGFTVPDVPGFTAYAPRLASTRRSRSCAAYSRIISRRWSMPALPFQMPGRPSR